jgi:hypothetical protein
LARHLIANEPAVFVAISSKKCDWGVETGPAFDAFADYAYQFGSGAATKREGTRLVGRDEKRNPAQSGKAVEKIRRGEII